MADAKVTISGTAPNQELSFEIPEGPRGLQGIQGPVGPQGPKGDDGAAGTGGSSASPQKNQIFAVRYINSVWEYPTLESATTAGLNSAQTVWFIGHPTGVAPTWARTGDIVSKP